MVSRATGEATSQAPAPRAAGAAASRRVPGPSTVTHLHLPENAKGDPIGASVRGFDDAPDDGRGAGERRRRGRAAASWRRAFRVGLICFVVWLLLDGPTLMKSASGSTIGTRRTVAMDVLRPIAWISRMTGLSHVMGAVDQALGRTGSAVVPTNAAQPGAQVSAGPKGTIPSTSSTTDPPVVAGGGPPTTAVPLLADGWPAFPPPTAAAPLRVLVVGDSVGTDLGQWGLVPDLGSTGVVRVTLDGQVDTGLSRPDYFNWPAELHADLGADHPQLVIVNIGANDPQSFIVGNTVYTYGTRAWDQEYAARVASFMDEATRAGARVLWVGMPPMDSTTNPALDSQVHHLDAIYAAEAKGRPGVSYVSSWSAMSGPHGSYAEYLTDSAGNEEQVRTDDGIHLTAAGAARMAQAVITDMDLLYHLTLHP